MNRYSWLSILLIMLLSGLLSGCQLTPSAVRSMPYESGRINIHQQWQFEDMYWQQSAVLSTAESEQTLLLSAYFRAEESRLVALTVTGFEIFRVQWTTDTFEVVGGELLPDQRLPYRVIADMQLALWPLASLQRQTKGLTLHENYASEWERVVMDTQGQTVLRIRADREPHLAEKILIEHELYQIEISTIEREFMVAGDD